MFVAASIVEYLKRYRLVITTAEEWIVASVESGI
jgi:hypothetical protein